MVKSYSGCVDGESSEVCSARTQCLPFLRAFPLELHGLGNPFSDLKFAVKFICFAADLIFD